MPDDALRRMLKKIYEDMRARSEPDFEERRENFVIHMTDWWRDLEELRAVYLAPDIEVATARKCVVAFLYHATPHLNAASRLLLDEVLEPFKENGAPRDS